MTARRPGLARRLGGLAVGQILVPLLLGVLADLIGHLTGSALLDALEKQSFTVFAYAVAFSPLIMLLSVAANGAALGRPEPAVVRAGRDGVRVARERTERWIPREEITGGLLVPGWRPRVQLQLTGNRVLEVEVPDEEQGARLLATLGIGPEERRVSVQLGSPNTQLAAGCAALPLAMVVWTVVIIQLGPRFSDPFAGPVLALGVILSVLLARRLTRPTEVVVGSDGVRVQKPFAARWLPYTELDFIADKESRLILGNKDGTHVALRAPRAIGHALAQRIREAQALGAAGGEARGAAALERQGRPLAAWREGLRGLLDQVGGYRASALTAEDVIAVLESPEAPRERRIGAALALAGAGHPEARARIRVAAESSADEELRAALEQAAEEEMDEAAVERALR